MLTLSDGLSLLLPQPGGLLSLKVEINIPEQFRKYTNVTHLHHQSSQYSLPLFFSAHLEEEEDVGLVEDLMVGGQVTLETRDVLLLTQAQETLKSHF